MFSFLAFMMMLAHNAIPHEHVPDHHHRYTAHKHPSLLEIIKCTFSKDLGKNHLNECTAPGNVEFTDCGVAHSFNLGLSLPVLTTSSSSANHNVHSEILLSGSNQLRAPPFFF